jgi:hypothetical protein
MLIEIYIEAILADDERADRIWEKWICGLISDDLAASAWRNVVLEAKRSSGNP